MPSGLLLRWRSRLPVLPCSLQARACGEPGAAYRRSTTGYADTPSGTRGAAMTLTSTGVSLGDFLEHEVYPHLTPEAIYTDLAHQWKHQSTRKWQGGCPWHQSKSGTSFVVSPDSLLWW